MQHMQTRLTITPEQIDAALRSGRRLRALEARRIMGVVLGALSQLFNHAAKLAHLAAPELPQRRAL